MDVLHRRIGVERAVMTTVHAYTSSKQLVDGPSKDFRRGRAGAANLIPASTGAALAATRALPELAGRFDGVALRVPVPVGSIADLTLVAARPADAAEVNWVLREAAAGERYRGALGVADDPLVSAGIVGDPRASIVDAAMTRVVHGTLVKVMSWYDNERASPTRWCARRWPCSASMPRPMRRGEHHPPLRPRPAPCAAAP